MMTIWEIKVRNKGGKINKFSDLLNNRLLFGENGNIKKNLTASAVKDIEDQSRDICII